jgi:hypothetical protein
VVNHANGSAFKLLPLLETACVAGIAAKLHAFGPKNPAFESAGLATRKIATYTQLLSA